MKDNLKKIDMDLVNQFKEGLEDLKSGRVRKIENIKKEDMLSSDEALAYLKNIKKKSK